MSVELACDALEHKVCLQIQYDGYLRLVEVHAVGRTGDGNWVMRSYQVTGGSVGGEPVGWKLFRFDKVRSAVISDTPSKSPRDGYRRNDRVMTTIRKQI